MPAESGRAEVDDAQRFLLANIVETYIQLNDAAQAEYEALLAEEANQEVATMEMTWADTLKAEGMRSLVVELLESRFGPLSGETRERLDAVTAPDELTRLFQRAPEAQSLGELGL